MKTYLPWLLLVSLLTLGAVRVHEDGSYYDVSGSNADFPSIYVADTGTPASTTQGTTYGVAQLELAESYDSSGNFSVTSGGDEVCYSGTPDINVEITLAISFGRDSAGTEGTTTLAFGQDTTGAIGNTDEFGGEYIRTLEGTDEGLGLIAARTTLTSASNCISLLSKYTTTAHDITVNESHLVIRED